MNPRNRHFAAKGTKTEDAHGADVRVHTRHDSDDELDDFDGSSRPAKVTTDNPDGYLSKICILLKKGEKNKGFKRRHFTIEMDRHSLDYYAEESIGVGIALGSIQLPGAVVLAEGEDNMITVSPDGTDRVYELQAANEE
jgi:hypothetical protein